jgi:hypothetical protein
LRLDNQLRTETARGGETGSRLWAPIASQADLVLDHGNVRVGDAQDRAAGPRENQKQAIPILDLPLPDSPPDGAEWIEAYRRWRR